VGPDVAVDGDEGIVAQRTERVPHAAAGLQRHLALVRVADRQAPVAAVAQRLGELVGEPGGVHHHLGHPGRGEAFQVPRDQRLAGHLQQRLGGGVGERAHALAQAGGEDQGLHGHRLNSTPVTGERAMSNLQVVLLSGGSGTRLWPLSREAYPKQFLPLAGEKTMLQDTWLRVAPLADGAPIVVANEEHRFLAAEQLRLVGVENPAIVLEPAGRNTAPAIAAAALQALAGGDDPLLLVLPSDHVVRDAEAFRAAVREAMPAAGEGALVTFGIVADAPETGFGYIQSGAGQSGAGQAGAGEGVRPVLRFVEKPDADTARGYLDSGDCYWNSGMFLFRASRYLEELGTFQPDIVAAVRRAFDAAARDGDFVRLDREAFAASPSDSIDYAVMENTDRAMVLPVDIGWNDVGSWSALWEVSEQDGDGNARQGEVIAIDSHGNYAYSRRLVALVGVDDLVVVETDDALLVARKDRVQQ